MLFLYQVKHLEVTIDLTKNVPVGLNEFKAFRFSVFRGDFKVYRVALETYNVIQNYIEFNFIQTCQIFYLRLAI